MYLRNLALDEDQQIWLKPTLAYDAMSYYVSVEVSLHALCSLPSVHDRP
jgi:hypothetical protein